MPDQRYEAARQTVGSLLATTSPKIEVPEWQRSYSWETAQVETFWQDLTSFGDLYPEKNIVGEEYFLGSIVLVVGGPTNLLLDGQQRLATATILLSVLRDARRTHKADAAARLQSKYISDFDDQSNTTTHVMTLNRYDRDFFRGEIQTEPAVPPSRPAPTLRSHSLIRKAREYFETRVTEQSNLLGGGEAAFQWNLRIGQVLCDHMSVVAVTSTDEDNAAAVFETLNDRGIGLSTPDLLRNLLLRRSDDEDSRERIIAAWSTVLSINEEASVEDFLRHYWVSHRGDVKSRKLYREIKSKILEEEINSLTFSLDLAENAPLYRDIVRARDDDPDLERLLAGIRALGAKALYPVVLSGYAAVGEEGETPDDRAVQKKNLQMLLQALIALFVRYNVIGGRETTVMETTVYEVAAQLRVDNNFEAAVARLATLAPPIDEFTDMFTRASISRVATARYLLREIEHAKRVTGEVAVEAPDKVHVEHIYPQTPSSAKWSNHTQMINRIGNLTLLSKRLNISIKNADFAIKKQDAYMASDILITKELVELDTWDEDAVVTRQRELSQSVGSIWGFPDETPPETTKATSGAEPLLADAPATDGASINVGALSTGSRDVEIDQLPEVPTG
jgi:Protein of unknown function DUF262/Protein of unknown function (DUF1524)